MTRSILKIEISIFFYWELVPGTGIFPGISGKQKVSKMEPKLLVLS
jgi:hypothetical protein